MTRRCLLVLMLMLGVAPVAGRASERPDDVVSEFFGIWDDNGRVTAERVAALYGREVIYYGERLSNAGVYANKRAFVRRWPQRRYDIVPGTVSKGCAERNQHCAVSVTLAWHAASPERGASSRGYTRVSLELEREDGTLKIVKESGHPVTAP